MQGGALKSFGKIIGIWALSYILLRLSMLPWRFVEKASVVELAISVGLLFGYYLLWKKIRPKFEPFEFPSISKSPPLILFFLWMIIYLGLWRASPQDFFIPQALQLKEYLLSNSIGGFFLSEVTEEIAYRGILLLLLLKAGLKPSLAIIIQATVFVIPHYIGLAHGQMDVMRTFSTFLLGSLFGWSMLSYRGLAMPIALHVFWNFISGFIFVYIEQASKH